MNEKHEQMKAAAGIIAHYGAEAQKDILIEECAELIQAVEKTRRRHERGHADDRPAFTADMVEEMADVQILIMQFVTVFGEYWTTIFEDTISAKLKRQAERIESERSEK